ncbi:phosphotransferase family protein [Aestuariicoccus sp. MJ-SS9]|uniref:phosphotransferase family protein n=1 Tax=Aestuariicoccus sp. MJ-SS9 TaxID=3079855 RepID=UPI00290641F2|nr:phosphotransferase [Aestuariicoccus sp. MJ-SS9]MDU8910860.1 phosphotransferase [Aestuariicoccus sp. MJ-SS9]
MKMLRDPLADAAMRHWPALAVEAGLRASDWRSDPMARREDFRVARIVMRMRHKDGRQLVLKHEARPKRPEAFMQAMAAHLAAHDGYPDGVPELFTFDVRAQSCVMAMVDAEPLSVRLEPEGANHGAILRAVGAWAAGFHRSGLGEGRVFQPKFTLDYLRRIVGELQRGERMVPEPEAFLRCAAYLCDRQADFEGQHTVTAQTHGDLHMRNVLVGEGGVWGIDFAGGNVVPVGHDLARLLVDYATLRTRHADIPAGEVLPPAASEAFFEGYTLVGPADPSVRLLLRHRVLADWWGLPHMRSAAQERRWAGLKSLVARVFADPLAAQ